MPHTEDPAGSTPDTPPGRDREPSTPDGATPTRSSTGGLRARPVTGAQDVALARELLARQAVVIDAPPVDETEEQRLRDAAEADRWAEGWQAVLIEDRGIAIAYGAVVAGAGDPRVPGTGDLAPDRDASGLQRALPLLIDELATRLPGAQTWIRSVQPDDLRAALDGGATIDRRLGVLGRQLVDPLDPPEPPAGLTIRHSVRGQDDEAITEVLAQAYAGTGDGGWTIERFQERQRLDWYRPEDLLVAARADGTLAGLHWLKRRDATTGEVYNLAVHPDAQGMGLGPVLLAAGLAHLRAVGCDDVVLWVDLANERAVRLYERDGFVTRWMDVALRLPG